MCLDTLMHTTSGAAMEKHCAYCRHYQREQTGPHEWTADCFLGQSGFPETAPECGFYVPAQFNDDEHWPRRKVESIA